MGLFGSVLGAVTSVIGGNAQKKAANRAADAQVQAAQLAIDEQRRQFDQTQQNFAPYLNSGTSALASINDLMGLGGGVDWSSYVQNNPDALANWNSLTSAQKAQFNNDISQFGEYHYGADGARRDISGVTTDAVTAQQGAIDALKASPLYTSLYRNGEEAILSNAAATGGLRGGNTQGALYNLGADTLSSVIQNQLSNLGGIANMGMGSAGQLGQFGATAASNIGSAQMNQGQVKGNAALLNGAYTAGQWKSVGAAGDSIISALAGFPGLSGGGGFKGTNMGQSMLDAGQIF